MRVLSQNELARLSKAELSVVLRQIASELPVLKEGSQELRIAHFNLTNIRRAMARPDFRPASRASWAHADTLQINRYRLSRGRCQPGPRV